MVNATLQLQHSSKTHAPRRENSTETTNIQGEIIELPRTLESQVISEEERRQLTKDCGAEMHVYENSFQVSRKQKANPSKNQILSIESIPV